LIENERVVINVAVFHLRGNTHILTNKAESEGSMDAEDSFGIEALRLKGVDKSTPPCNPRLVDEVSIRDFLKDI